MNEYLEQALLNCIRSNKLMNTKRPLENDSQWIVDEDDQVFYMEGWVNGVSNRWTVNKPIRMEL